MRIRRLLLFFSVFLAGSFLGRPLALASFGLLVKSYLFFCSGIFFSYGTVTWEEGALVFSSVQLEQERAFCAKIRQVRIHFQSKFLEIDRPLLKIIGEPRLGEGQSDWLFSVKEGWLEKDGVGGVSFCCERNWQNQIGRFVFEKEAARCAVEAIYEGDEVWIDALLSECQLNWLEPWVGGRMIQGSIDGQLHLVWAKGDWKRGSGALKVEGGGYGGIVSNLQGNVDWEGSAKRGWLSDGRFRLSVNQGTIVGTLGKIEALQGECSFVAGVGAKCMLEGRGDVRGETLPFSWMSRVFLSTSRPHWIESEAILGQGRFSLEGKEDADGYHWNGKGDQLGVLEGTLLQGLLALGDPSFSQGSLEEGLFYVDAAGWIPRLDQDGFGDVVWESTVSGEKILYRESLGLFSCEQGALSVHGKSSDLTGSLGQFTLNGLSFETAASKGVAIKAEKWNGRGEIIDGNCIASQFEGVLAGRHMSATLNGFLEELGWSWQIRGEVEGGMGFYCPILRRGTEGFCFDVRLENTVWDWIRLCGIWNEQGCHFDLDRTHILGEMVHIDEFVWDAEGFDRIFASFQIPFSSILPILSEHIPSVGNFRGEYLLASFSLDKEKGISLFLKGEDFGWNNQPLVLNLSLFQEQEGWRFSDCQVGDVRFSAKWRQENEIIRILEGKVAWEDALQADVSGYFDLAKGRRFWQLQCSAVTGDLGKFCLGQGIEECSGLLEGKGCISWRGTLEADFDFFASRLEACKMNWENEGPLHVMYSSSKGMLCSGLDLYASDRDFHIKIPLLEYNLSRDRWRLQNARLYLSSELFPNVQNLAVVGIDWSADLDFPSDLSSWHCFVRDGLVAWEGTSYGIRDLSLSVAHEELRAEGFYGHLGQMLKIGAVAHLRGKMGGRFWISQTEEGSSCTDSNLRPLSFEWTYSEGVGFEIQSIEGQLAGLETSFHRLPEEEGLMGMAKIHFGQISPMMPERLSQLFSDLEMGKGYELKGKLYFRKGDLVFDGLFSGKQIDLFGYEFRTLLGQIHVEANRLELWDLKISDSAGIMKIDRIEAAGVGEDPWTIAMPKLTIAEFRPSLLQKVGKKGSSEPAGPLVVRELVLENFRGLLDEAKTYRASGELVFINSYRREHTVFDLPADILGRIMGLDLELLIPVCGSLRYELRDGFFYLQELKEAYSEAQRSQFFLVPDPAPVMDLDGNLKILVNMKQFVLFKFTESFLISIDGQLSDPQFHLQKKRRFLSL